MNSPSRPEHPVSPEVERSLRTRLDDARRAADEALREYEEAVGNTDVIQEDRDTARQVLEEARAWLQTAEAAVERLEAGEYGRCTNCGEAIAPERLEALPDTVTCRACSH